MNQSDVETKYPEINKLLHEDFWQRAKPHHPLVLNLREDNTEFFDQLSELVSSVPAGTICSSSQRANIHTTNEFESLLSEFIGYVIIDKWVCSSPTVVDGSTTAGGPEFHCRGIDIEVARLRQSREIDRVRSHLSNKLGGGVRVEIDEKSGYELGSSDKEQWDDNEAIVDSIISKLTEIERDQLPVRYEIDGLQVEVTGSESEIVQMIVRSQMKQIDETNDLQYILKKKTVQKYRGNPIIFFIDIQRQNNFPEDQDDVIQETIGESFSDGTGNHEVSEKALNVDTTWQDYMIQIGCIPTDDPIPIAFDEWGEPASYGYHKLRDGYEGVFTEGELSNVAGILFRTGYGEIGYVPNVYTTTVDAAEVYDCIGWGTQMIELQKIPELPSFIRPRSIFS